MTLCDLGLLEQPRWIAIPSFSDARGSLGVMEWDALPFTPVRVYFIHGTAPGATRAGHSHRKSKQLLVALNGAFTAVTRNGPDVREYRLENPEAALYIPPPVWLGLKDFSPGAVCLVVASEPYDRADYFDDADRF